MQRTLRSFAKNKKERSVLFLDIYRNKYRYIDIYIYRKKNGTFFLRSFFQDLLDL